jgi:uncharacterized protein YbjT (DUF2867 family)
MKVLAIGATGKFANLVIPEMTKLGITVRALIRDESKRAAAMKRGATEIAIGNLNDPKSLQLAARGVDGVFHINPAFDPTEANMGVAMVNAAKSAGVRKFVFSSVYHPSLSMSNHAGKRAVEAALYESGMDFTILQPPAFMQNLDAGWKTVIETGKIVMPYSVKAKVSYVDYRDVAEVAALAFVDDSLSNGTFELCSEGMVDRLEIARIMSDALDRHIEAAEVDFEEWANEAHLPPGPLREGLAAMNANYNKYGFRGGNSLVLEAILGREPRTLEQYITELASRRIAVPEHV